jgi:hypothetical protein
VFAAVARAADSAPSSPIDAGELSATVKTLASDAFQGRAPGRSRQWRPGGGGCVGERLHVSLLPPDLRLVELGLEPGRRDADSTSELMPLGIG